MIHEGLAHLANQKTDVKLPPDLGPASLFIDSPQEECGEYDDCFISDGSGNWQSAGPIPGGPYDSCWNYIDFACNTCHGVNYGWVVDQCNATYSVCATSKENSCADAGTCFLEPSWGQDC